MKTSIKMIAIVASLVSASAFADGYTPATVNLFAISGAATGAAGVVTQGRHTRNYVTSGAAVETAAGSQVAGNNNSVVAQSGSATEGAAWGNGTAGYIGGSATLGSISIAPRSHSNHD